MKSVDELGEETDIERVFVANSGRTDLTGLQVGDYIVDGLLKDGVYSQIFHGLNVLNGESVAIKRPAPQLTLAAQQSYSSLETGVFLTGAYAQDFGGLRSVEPCPDSVFLAQLESLSSYSHPNIVQLLDCSRRAGIRWMSMPFLAAPTLRSCLSRRAGFDAKNIACRLATVVSTANRSGWRHHDLKPENIILSADGLVLIDPGHFGPLQLMSGQTVDVAITTPAYNPGIEPNDLMAFGLIFFELVTGVLPTRFASSSHDSDAGKSLLLMIEEAEITGNFNYSGLKCFQRPAKLFSGCSDQLERLMLFLLGLELQDDKIEVRNEPVTWVEAIEMLHQTTFTGLT